MKAGRIVANCVPHAVLTMLKVKGNIERRDMLKTARALAGSDSRSVMALKRLRDSGLIALEYRLTKAGEKALAEVNRG